jgi:hypothetical protein
MATPSRFAEIARSEKRFMESPEHWELGYKWLEAQYLVSETVIRRWKRAVGALRPNRYMADHAAKLERLVTRHELFGMEGQPAPMAAPKFVKVLAEEGIVASQDRIYRLRKRYGVEPSINYNKPGVDGPRRLTEEEKRNYKLCAKVRSWGRPAGMEEYLSEIS